MGGDPCLPWQDYGYNLVIFIAALQGSPRNSREAAVIDGASPWQVFTRITVPLLRPTLLFVCVMTMLSSFQVFDIIQVMTEGGPNDQTRTLVLDIYDNAFPLSADGVGRGGLLCAGLYRHDHHNRPDAPFTNRVGVLRWLPMD